MNSITLSRRNLRVLLNKLDRKARGEETACALIVDSDQGSYTYVAAVENEGKYALRDAGPVHPKDEPR